MQSVEGTSAIRVRRMQLARRARTVCCLTASVLPVLTLPAAARADSFTWDGGGNGYYNVATDWVGNVAPQSTDSLATFTFGLANYNNDNPTDALGYEPYSITFADGAIPYNLSGTSGKTLSIGSGGISDLTSAAETISEPISIAATQSWELSSGVAAPVLTASGGISGPDNLTVGGNGTAVIGGTSSYSQTITVNSGNFGFAAGVNFTGTATLVLGNHPGDPVTATVAGGNVSVGTISISNGTGEVTPITLSQTAGSLTARTINIAGGGGDIGTFDQSGGLVSAVLFSVGSAGNGVFNQSGGQLTVSGTYNVPQLGAISGIVLMSGNALENFPSLALGETLGPGFFNQSGGTVNCGGNILIGNGGGGTGIYFLSGGTVTAQNFEIGNTAIGKMDQSAGLLNADSIYVGAEATGTFNQSGGTSNAPGGVTVGLDSGSAGTVNFTGGTLNTAVLVVGNQGVGTFVQTGGTVNVAQGSTFFGLILGQSSGSNGTYQLSGGQLEGGTITGGNGTGLLQFNGGSFVITASGAGGLQEVPTTIMAGGAYFNTPSGIVSRVTVTLQHDSSSSTDGGLTKQGGGRLDLQNYNTYNGPTTIQGGTLALDYGYDGTRSTISYASAINVSAGTLQLGAAAGENNTLGLGAYIAPLAVAAGSSVTEYAGTTQTIGSLTLTGGTVTGSGSPPNGSPDFTLTAAVVASGANNSSISAAGGINLSGTLQFSVQAGGGTLLVAADLVDAPGNPGGLTKAGRGAALILSGDDTYTGPTTVNAGLVQLAPSASLPNSAITLLNNARLELTASNAGLGVLVRSLSSLTIQSTAQLTIDPPPTPANRQLLVIHSLSFGSTTATIDVTGNDLDLPGVGLSTIAAKTALGYAEGTWNGSGGITSSSAAGDTSHLTALGLIQNNQDGSAIYTAANPFDTYTPDAGDILIKYTYYGDANLDGKVDGSDYTRIDAGYASGGALTGWFNGDFNYDGIVDGSDYALIDNAFNNQGADLSSTALVAAATAQAASVPEPASMAGAMAGLILMRRRRAVTPR